MQEYTSVSEFLESTDFKKLYKKRLVDSKIHSLLNKFGAVEIAGPKWCGKTWTASYFAKSVDSLAQSDIYQLAQTDANLVLEGARPHLIDEWQLIPQIWDSVRMRIDANANMAGQFLLTGSAFPKNLEQIHHSGTGRIAHVSMYPMALSEFYDTCGGISLKSLFDGKFKPMRKNTTLEDIAHWCCLGGWPSLLSRESSIAFSKKGDEHHAQSSVQGYAANKGAAQKSAAQESVALEYLENIINNDFVRLKKSPDTESALLKALSANLAQAPTYETLSKDMQLGDRDKHFARATIDEYIAETKRLFLLQDLGGWEPPLRSKKRVRIRPKRYFVDPSLPAAILGATPATLKKDMQTLGLLFESLCYRDLVVYMSTFEGIFNRLHYYRDDTGLEVDFVLELSDGRWGAFEAKLSDTKIDDKAIKRLLRFKKKVTSNPKGNVQEPSFLGFLVGKSQAAYMREDDICVIPISCLEP